MKIPASYHQERLWFIDAFEKGSIYDDSPVYHNVPIILSFKGKLRWGLLQECFQAIMARHEVLRTAIRTEQDKPYQIISKDADFGLECVDASGEGLENIIKRAIEFAKEPFSLETDTLVKGKLYAQSEDQHILALSIHHLLVDRRSTELITQEFVRLYEQKVSEDDQPEEQMPLQYADFSQWQSSLSDEALEPHLLHWRRQFPEKPAALELPEDTPRPAIHTFTEGRVSFNIEGQQFELLQRFTQTYGTSIELVMMAAFKVLMARYADQEEVIIGMVGENRRQSDLKKVIGPFGNLLPIKSNLDKGLTFADFICQLSNDVNRAIKFQDIPFDKLVMELNPQNDMSRTALFDVLFQYRQNVATDFNIEGLEVNVVETNLGWGKYDLNLLVTENDSISAVLVFNTDIFERERIARLAEYYQIILQSAIDRPDQSIWQLNMLSDEERSRLLNEDAESVSQYHETLLIHHVFEEIAAAHAQRTAVVFGENKLTYTQLNERADHLATILRKSHRIQPNDFVGIMLERSESMIVAMLAVLKSGGAYVPIDPSYPEDRIQYILKDSACRVLITTEGLVEQIEKPEHCQTIDIDCLPDIEVSELVNVNQSGDTAYVIYTSGTTGNPKGCMVAHQNLVSLMKHDQHSFSFDENDVWVMAHSFCFDFSVWETYGALLYGGTVIMPDWDTVRDTQSFLNFIKKHKVTVLNQTPSAFNNLIEIESKVAGNELGNHLRYVVFGGDKLSPESLKTWTKKYSLDQVKLINMYGITETTVHVTFHELTASDLEGRSGGSSPIGKALPGVHVYILDRFMNPVGTGVTGELYVGGSGVSKGYWQREELTAERFIQNPFKPEERIYKTGDIGFWDENGEINFVGRNDKQVKIRGYRIELGEVEQCLRDHENVSAAVVTVLDDDFGSKQLCGYVVLEEGKDVASVKAHAAKVLPSYMVPSFIIKLAKLPLTFNGKVDHKSLPDPRDEAYANQGHSILVPRNERESQLLSIWQEVLSRDSIGVDQNFFEIGGHSLKATRVISRIHKAFDIKLDLKSIFENPTIEGLAKLLGEKGQDQFEEIKPVQKADHYALSMAQKRIWLAWRLDKSSTEYNVPQAYKIEGGLDREVLQKTIESVIARHEALRTTFGIENDEPYQCIAPAEDFNFSLVYIDLSSEDEQPANERAILLAKEHAGQNLDLESGPLFKAQLIKTGEERYIFSIVLHHIISDGWSMEVLLSEISKTYTAKLKNEKPALPELAVQYKDFAAWHNDRLKGEQLLKLRQFWLDQMEGHTLTASIPFDKESRSETMAEGRTIKTTLETALSNQLMALNLDQKLSYYISILAAIKILISRYSGLQEILVGSPTAGRNHAALEHQIGYYANTMLFRTTLAPDSTVEQAIEAVRNTVLQAFDHEDYPYNAIVEDLALNTNGGLLFDTGFTWHDAAGVSQSDDDQSDELPFTIEPLKTGADTAITPLWFHGYQTDEGLELAIDYDASRYEKTTIEMLMSRLKKILESMTQQRDIKINDIAFEEKVAPKAKMSIDLNI
ncbi:MAG: amino acid adenylation domain-containing protein [Bacteroidota bacterium]